MKKRSNWLARFTVGIWLSTAVVFGILSQSWGNVLAIILFGAFFASFELYSMLGKMDRKVWRLMGTVGLFINLLLMLGFFFTIVERVLFEQSPKYRAFLIENSRIDLVSRSIDIVNTVERLRQAGGCKGMAVSYHEEKDDVWLIRCGEFWFDGSTFVSEGDPFGDSNAQKEDAQ